MLLNHCMKELLRLFPEFTYFSIREIINNAGIPAENSDVDQKMFDQICDAIKDVHREAVLQPIREAAYYESVKDLPLDYGIVTANIDEYMSVIGEDELWKDSSLCTKYTLYVIGSSNPATIENYEKIKGFYFCVDNLDPAYRNTKIYEAQMNVGLIEKAEFEFGKNENKKYPSGIMHINRDTERVSKSACAVALDSIDYERNALDTYKLLMEAAKIISREYRVFPGKLSPEEFEKEYRPTIEKITGDLAPHVVIASYSKLEAPDYEK